MSFKMKLLTWSFFLFGLFLTGSTEFRGRQYYLKLIDDFQRNFTASVKVEEWENYRLPKFDFYTNWTDENVARVSGNADRIRARIQELPDNSVNEAWNSDQTLVTNLLGMFPIIRRFFFVKDVEESGIRMLSMAVMQSYDYDPRLPNTTQFVDRLRGYVNVMNYQQWMNGEFVSAPDLPMPLEKQKLYAGKVERFLNPDHLAVNSARKNWNQETRARFQAEQNKAQQAFRTLLTALPVQNEANSFLPMNRALMILADYYRTKAMCAIPLSGLNIEPEVFQHLSEGDEQMKAILLLVKSRRLILH